MPVAVIVGAGPAGCVAAASFAKRGWHVHVYERGEGPEWALADSSRVYPLMLCSRATQAIEDAGLPIPPCAVPCEGIYSNTKRVSLRPAGGTGPHAYRYLTNRLVLAVDLYRSVSERYRSSVVWHWGRTLQAVDFEARVATFSSQGTAGSETATYDLLVGADGVGSAVRRELERADTGVVSEVVYAPTSTYKTFHGLPTSTAAQAAVSLGCEASTEFEGTTEDEESHTDKQHAGGTPSEHFSASTAAKESYGVQHTQANQPDVTEKQAEPSSVQFLEPVPGFSGHSPLSHVYFSFRPGGSTVAFIKEKDDSVSGILWGQVPSWDAPDLATMLATQHPHLPPEWRGMITRQTDAHSGQPPHGSSRITHVSQLHGPRCVLVGDAGHAVTSALGHGCNAAIESAWVLAQCLDGLGGSAVTDAQLSQLPAAYNAARLADVHALQYMEHAMSLLMGGTSSVAGPWAMPLKARLLILPCEMGAFLGHKLLPSLFPTPGFMRDALADARVPYSQVLSSVRLRSTAVLAGAAAVMVGLGWAVWSRSSKH